MEARPLLQRRKDICVKDCALPIRSKMRNASASFFASLERCYPLLGRYAEGHTILARRINNRTSEREPRADLCFTHRSGNQFSGDLGFHPGGRVLRRGLALARQIGHREWMSLAYINLDGFVARHASVSECTGICAPGIDAC